MMYKKKDSIGQTAGRRRRVDGVKGENGVKRMILAVCSLKGGAGCSTVAAGLAAAFARRGKKTLAVDLDPSLHSLDFFFGMQDRILFGLPSFLDGSIDAERLVCRDETLQDLYVCISSEGAEESGLKNAPEKLIELAEKEDFGVVILDLPGRGREQLAAFTPFLDGIVVVCGQDAPSVYAAEKAALELADSPVCARLVIDRFDISDLQSYAQGRTRALEIIDQSRLPLLGIVPESYSVRRRCEEGLLSSMYEKEPDAPFMNIAARLCGENVPLFEGCGGERIRKKL